MRGSLRIGLAAIPVLVAALARPAASDSCPEVDRDERGRCAPRPAPDRKAAPKPEPKPEPKIARKTELDIQGADIAGARVSLDSKPAGFAPVILEATPGRHLVELRKDGRAPYSTSVDAKQGERVTVAVTLQPPGGPPPPIEPKQGSCPTGMMQVPAGTFKMTPRNAPPREVTLAGYCIDKLEVTVKDYAACVAASACSPAPGTGSWPGKPEAQMKRYSLFCTHDDRPDHPINCVDWYQAEGRTYPWGNDPPSMRRLNACGTECVAMARRVMNAGWSVMYKASDTWEATAPVGSFPDGASPFGALDMEGNVKEWTGSATGLSSTKPGAPDPNRPRIFRGSGWDASHPQDVDGLTHWSRPATERSHDVGFRCARGN